MQTKKKCSLESLSSYKLGWQVRKNCCSDCIWGESRVVWGERTTAADFPVLHHPWHYLCPLSLEAAVRMSENFVHAWSLFFFLSARCPCTRVCVCVCVYVSVCLFAGLPVCKSQESTLLCILPCEHGINMCPAGSLWHLHKLWMWLWKQYPSGVCCVY